MHTRGYSFQPWWSENTVADGCSILKYINETAIEHGVDKYDRYGQRVSKAEWHGTKQCWKFTIKNRLGGTTFSCVHILKAAPATSHKMIYKLPHLRFLMNLRVILFILNPVLLILIAKDDGLLSLAVEQLQLLLLPLCLNQQVTQRDLAHLTIL